jgi:hypothetical protein
MIKAFSTFSIFILIISCSEEIRVIEPEPLTNLEKAEFKYEYLYTTPEYYQSLMMTGTDAELFVYGAYGGFFIFDLSRKGWTATHFFRSDTVSWRWDGAIGYANEKVYVIATPRHNVNINSFPKYYNILEVDPKLGKVTALPALLPFTQYEYYPAYGTYKGKMAVIFPNLDSVYVFDANKKTGSFVAQNPLKLTQPDYYYMNYIFGTNKEYLFVYGKRTKEFYKFDLEKYIWHKIEIDSNIQSRILGHIGGSMFKNLFCIWIEGSDVALVYNNDSGKWIEANKDIPNDNFLLGEGSFFANDSALYSVEVMSQNLWRISLVNKK